MCYWPGMGTTVMEVCDSCERCQKRKTPATRAPLRQLNMKTGPMAQISMDFLNIDNRNEAKYKVLTVVDNFTKFGFAFDVKSLVTYSIISVIWS